jgi:hypothetical protein
MPSILALSGYNRSLTAVNKLFAVYGSDIVDVDTNTGYQQNLTANTNGEFAPYLDYLFYVNGLNSTRSFNGTSWSTNGMANHAPIFKYLKPYGVKLYGAYPTIQGQTFPSRVWHTDNPYNYTPRWGLEYGTSLDQTAGSSVVTADGTYFKTYGIKAADNFFILTGANAGQYTVESIDSNNQITLLETLDHTVSDSTFIVGSNYFDVRTDDNDHLMGLGVTSNRLMCYKQFSLHRYNGSSLIQVPRAPGTSSGRSIVDDVEGFSFYFHGSDTTRTGIYRFDGEGAVKVSAGIQPYIDGIPASAYGSPIGWREGEWYRCYVGDITNTQRGISVSKAVISYNALSNYISIDPIEKTPVVSARFLESGQEKVFFGDNAAGVYQTPSGFSFDGAPIPWAVETGPHYPLGSEAYLHFVRIQVIARDARGVRVRFRLYNAPKDVDDQWTALGDITNDKTEFNIRPEHSNGCGIEFRFEENGIRENTQYIEKVTVFYTFDTSRTL